MGDWISFVHGLNMMTVVITIFSLLNIWTFVLYAWDKQKAKKGSWRIRERTLLGFTLLGGGIGAIFGMYYFRHKTRKIKFKVWVPAGFVIAIIVVIHIINGLTFGRTVRFVELDFHSANWPEALNGYRIAFMTDMHSIPDKEMASVIEVLNQSKIDLLLLGGDFADYSRNGDFFEGTLREISKARATDGIWGVEGNHDNYARLFDVKARYGINILDNTGHEIQPGFYLGGVHDAWNRQPSIEDAVADANEDDFILLITHNPDVSMWQPTNRIDLILAGHTHGGQITFFGYPFILHVVSVTQFGTRFAGGFAESADGVPVFTSIGVGPNYGWPRVFAQPEVVIFTMFAE